MTTPEAKGAHVVCAAVQQIQNTGIFPDDRGLLRRIAMVESRDGEHPDTYKPGYHGGIWQVDEIGFRETQAQDRHPALAQKFAAINRALGISWPNVRWQELRKPLFSALAARIHMFNVNEAIPADLRGQAVFWKKYYNTSAGVGTPEAFIQRVGNV